MDTKRLRELREGAIKTHPICLNDPDYGEGGDPDASYCHLCWEQSRDKQAFLDAASVAIPVLLEEREKLIGALREISEGRGRFSLDNFEHARNTIEDMKARALAALGEGRQVG